jgi:hypothetical protein
MSSEAREMVALIKGLAGLAQVVDDSGFCPLVQLGDVYVVRNRDLQGVALNFKKCSELDFHPVVVVRVNQATAEVRVMTTKLSGYRTNGILYHACSDVRLKKRVGIILTRKCFHRVVPLEALQQRHYRSNVGLGTLDRIRAQEKALNRLDGGTGQPR